MYHLVFGDAVEFEEGHVTMSSPIGRALLGKAVGDEFVLRLPALTRQLKLVELQTIHDAMASTTADRGDAYGSIAKIRVDLGVVALELPARPTRGARRLGAPRPARCRASRRRRACAG